MGRQTIVAQGLDYLVSDDLTTIYRALISGQVKDVVSAGPLLVSFSVVAVRNPSGTALPELELFVLEDGSYCLAGYEERVFPDRAVAYQIDLTVQASGYTSALTTVTIGPQATYPVNAAQVKLRPQPVRLRGRVVNQLDRSAVAAASVWTVDDPAAATAEHVVALGGRLRFDHAATIGPNPAPVQPLARAAGTMHLASPSGVGMVLDLDDRTGVLAGDILAVGDRSPQLERVASLGPSLTMSPGQVTINNPLQGTFPSGTLVQAYRATGAPFHLKRQVFAGDGVLILDALLEEGALEIADANPTHVERQVVGTTSDSQGYYELQGVGRVTTVWLRAKAGMLHSVAPVAWTIAYRQPINFADLPVTQP